MIRLPEPAWAGLRDHTYLILDDGSLFCATGNQHTATEVLGCLYYVPASAIGGWNIKPGQMRTLRQATAPDGSPCYKIGPTIALDPAWFAKPLRARGVRWWPTTHLQAVAHDRIAKVLDPITGLTRILPTRHRHRCPLEILTWLVAEATTGGVPADRIGLTGSAAFNDANVCAARDIDLVLIHPVRFATFAAAVREGLQPLARLGHRGSPPQGVPGRPPATFHDRHR